MHRDPPQVLRSVRQVESDQHPVTQATVNDISRIEHVGITDGDGAYVLFCRRIVWLGQGQTRPLAGARGGFPVA